MPAVAAGIVVGGFVTGAGATIAGSVLLASTVYGAIAGAVMGAVLGKGNVLKNAVNGALQGAGAAGVASGAMGFMAGTGGAAGAGTKAVEASLIGEAGASGVGSAPSAGLSSGSLQNIAAADKFAASQKVAGGAGGETGLLSRAMSFIENKPETSKILAQGIGGAAKGYMDQKTSQTEIDALMERDRLNRESQMIGGLGSLKAGTAIPQVGGFLERPKWVLDSEDAGLLQRRNV